MLFSTPRMVVHAARAALALIAIALFLFGLSVDGVPLGVEMTALTAITLLACLFGLTLAMIALPWSRKSDLLKGAIILLGAVTAARMGTADNMQALADGCAGLIGLVAAYVPLAVEQLRYRARTYGDILFEVIEIEDRRGRARRLKAMRRDRDRSRGRQPAGGRERLAA